jgi:hypothetical protein
MITTVDGLLFLSFKRQEVAMLYDIFVEHIRENVLREKERAERENIESILVELPDNFLLTSAFACIFDDLKLTGGYTSFASSDIQIGTDTKKKTGVFSFPIHYWLTFVDENHIIDVLPYDGFFGVSTPQAIIQSGNKKRFFAKKDLYPSDWGIKEKTIFEDKLRDVVNILEYIKSKVDGGL